MSLKITLQHDETGRQLEWSLDSTHPIPAGYSIVANEQGPVFGNWKLNPEWAEAALGIDFGTLKEHNDKLNEIAHLASIGASWRKDSSLERWFPLTAEELAKLRTEVASLREKNMAWALGVEQSNTDIVDMQRDEFRRIIALTEDREIKGICERAIACIEQTVPVVVQRDAAVKQHSDLYALVESYLCTPNTSPAVKDAYDALVAWFVRNKRPDGTEPRPVSPEQDGFGQ